MSITEIVNNFCDSNDPTHRYSSYDYCYNYFYKTQNIIIQDSEKSCAIIGFYLASWGMMRGSSFLLQKSYKYYKPLVKYISKLENRCWDIDVNNYNIEYSMIIQIYNEIKDIIIENNQRDIVLVTKIMMGVLGITPAYDSFFCNTFKQIEPNKSRFTTFNESSLEVIYNFYCRNKNEIDTLSRSNKTIDYITEKERYCYKKAKIIDMYGVEMGS